MPVEGLLPLAGGGGVVVCSSSVMTLSPCGVVVVSGAVTLVDSEALACSSSSSSTRSAQLSWVVVWGCSSPDFASFLGSSGPVSSCWGSSGPFSFLSSLPDCSTDFVVGVFSSLPDFSSDLVVGIPSSMPDFSSDLVVEISCPDFSSGLVDASKSDFPSNSGISSRFLVAFLEVAVIGAHLDPMRPVVGIVFLWVGGGEDSFLWVRVEVSFLWVGGVEVVVLGAHRDEGSPEPVVLLRFVLSLGLTAPLEARRPVALVVVVEVDMFVKSLFVGNEECGVDEEL